MARLDRFQDCRNFQAQAENSGNAISWMFTRVFDTCHDNEDYVIEVFLAKAFFFDHWVVKGKFL